ncbi:MAG: mandelate racemase/muconate lactonizing enzyme family protein [Thaumarchaeota archaeon]|jgi:L-alanine-DL-glutamate epimerase-like enolase superfamily enzyme|nr:mandelate racemase/muconate lactonizing enzyme family protein [Candidatus Terraquivivens yellowstonensis]
MRIESVRAFILKKPLEKPLITSKAELKERATAIVQVRTDDGIEGLGEGVGVPNVIKEIVEKNLAPMLIGEDPFDIERLWRKMFQRLYWEPKGAWVCAISAVEMALWDVAGKAMDVPVYKLIGGLYRDKLEAYASDIFWDETDEMAKKAASFVEQGFRYVKCHIGKGFGQDDVRVRAMRRAIGKDAELMVDINCGYDRPTAIKFAEIFEENEVFWYEEPLPPFDLEGYKLLRDYTDLPIATGENEFTKYGFRDMFLKGVVDYAMPDLARVGGILEGKKVCALAESFNVICSPHVFSTGILLAATLHLMASTPGTELFELDTTGTGVIDEFLVEPLEVRDGYVYVPKGPGLGVQLSEKAKRYLVQ